MKTKIIFLFLFWTFIVWGQDTNGKKYQKGLGNNIANNIYTRINTLVTSSNMRGDFSVDVSKDFLASLKLNMETKDKNFSILLQNDIGSTNSYTPLFSEGKWAIDNSLGATAKWHFETSRWVFNSDHESLKQKGLSNDSIFSQLDKENKLSQYRTQWISAGLKWDYKEYMLLADDLTPTTENPFISKRLNSYVISAAWNMLWVTSYKHGIYFTGSLGYSFQNRGTNYSKLENVVVQRTTEIREGQDVLLVSEPEKKGKKGTFLVSNAHTITSDLHLTIAPPKFGVGFDIFFIPSFKFIETEKIFNIRTGLNVAITKDDKSKVNIGFVVDFKDFTEPYKDREDRQNRIIPGLIVGIPIPNLKK